LHSPNESDTALPLYEGDIFSQYYQHYGFYGRPNFMELAKRLGILEKRAERVLLGFIDRKDDVLELVHGSFLPDAVKMKYIKNYMDKVDRLSLVL